MDSTLKDLLPLILPLLLIQLLLIIAALRDLAGREKTKGPKWLWVIIICVGEMIGPAAYFLVGREE